MRIAHTARVFRGISRSCDKDGHAAAEADARERRLRRDLVELSGIEPLTSSLRIQGSTSDRETPDETE
jgi:hypothetical protein